MMTTVPDTDTITLPGSLADLEAAIAGGGMFIVTGSTTAAPVLTITTIPEPGVYFLVLVGIVLALRRGGVVSGGGDGLSTGRPGATDPYLLVSGVDSGHKGGGWN